MHVCPDCRAGKEWITVEATETALLRMKLKYECERCGTAKTERAKL